MPSGAPCGPEIEQRAREFRNLCDPHRELLDPAGSLVAIRIAEVLAEFRDQFELVSRDVPSLSSRAFA